MSQNLLQQPTYDAALVADIQREVLADRQQLVELCAAMVAAQSINPPGCTAGMAKVVLDFLHAQGLPAEWLAVDEEAPNVVSTLVAPQPGKHVVFNAHMDTMQAGDETAWTVPPLALTRKDGRLYGLGMGNMKGALAAMALAMKIVHRRLPSLAGRLSLTAVSDEVMFGARGSPFVLQNRPDLYGDVMISGEGPGSMGFAVAEKGLLWLDVQACGPVGHSSRARIGETAVARLAVFLAQLDALNALRGTVPVELEGVEGGEDDVGLRVSVSVGTLQAGEIRSLMAPVARACVDIRLPPGIRLQDLKQRIDALAVSCSGVSVSDVKGWSASWAALDSKLVKSIADAAEQVRREKVRYVVRLPGSDARYWRDAGVPAVCYGPQPTLSSGVDDYANEQDVIDCAVIYALAAMRLMKDE